jgi:hypothetical protein
MPNSEGSIMKLIQQSVFKFFVGACFALFCLGLAHGGVGIGGTGRTSFGEITEFGSIFVNGIEYSTSSANIIINGVAGRPESELRLGMAVRVEGSINADGKTGIANTVEFSGDIEATIDAAPVITGSRGTFTMYGIVIKTDSKTKYENVSGLAALAAGDAVEVSGFFNGNDGSFSATLIEKQFLFRKVELRGFTSNVTATTFKLGPSLVVNYSAAQLKDIPPGGLANGQYVEVKATSQATSNTLQATRVSVESSILASANIAFGLVKGITANVSTSGAAPAKAAGDGSFVMGNQLIVTNAQTVFTDAPLGALANGIKAFAAGPVVNGIMTAEIVSIILPVTSALDLNGDGKSDLLLRNTSNGQIDGVIMNGYTATASAAFMAPGSGWTATHAADLNGDGKADILWRHADGRVAAWLMDGLTATAGGIFMSAGSGWTVTQTADLNGDGKADILWRHTDGRVAAWLMDGLSAIGGNNFMLAGSGWSITNMADLNGDGKADILWRHADGRVAAWLMDGLGAISGATLLAAPNAWSITHMTDLNGDGKADILWRHTDGTVATWLMNGVAITAGATLLAAPNAWSITHTADLNGDGKADIVWRHTNGTVASWLMNGVAMTTSGTLIPAPNAWAIAFTGDLNGDGKADLVWRHPDGRLATWLMNGTTQTAGSLLAAPGTLEIIPQP